ncbi:MAG: threonine/serine dehydratase [Deltaproteobacteria bacterium]|nr:threonine/serine dehydratase [Deltaproteobacteria bacterium]
MSPVTAPDPSVVAEAAERLRGAAHRTPVFHSTLLDEACGARVFLKAECLQRVGAFKFRGAYNTLSQLSEEERARGVITHSSGNHAQALALAARLFETEAVVVMPHDAPASKRAATAGYGARIVPCDAKEREAVCQAEIDAHGYTLVHPYDDPRIIAGAGTAARELLEDHPGLSLILTPVGGGGLVSGTSLAAAAHRAGGGACQVIGVEPEIADDARQSLARGEVVTLPEVPPTIADGLRTRHIGEHNLAVISEHLQAIVTVSEAAIVEALRLVWSRTKLLIEPSSAVPVAALLTGAVKAEGEVGVILSGGNVDPTTLSL